MALQAHNPANAVRAAVDRHAPHSHRAEPEVLSSERLAITASAGGVSKTASLKVGVPVVLAPYTLSPPSVTGGMVSKGTVTLTGPAPTGGLVVTLQRKSFCASVPTSVTVVAGYTNASFNVQSHPVTTASDAKLYAGGSGVTFNSYLHIIPAALSGVGLSAGSVTSGGSVTGTVTLTGPAPSGGSVVGLASNKTAATVPASVTVGAGSSAATFSAKATTAAISTPVTITATYAGANQTAPLTVNPISAHAAHTVRQRLPGCPPALRVALLRSDGRQWLAPPGIP